MYRDFIRCVSSPGESRALPLGKNKAVNGIGQYLAWKTDEADKEIGDHFKNAPKETRGNQVDEENRASI